MSENKYVNLLVSAKQGKPKANATSQRQVVVTSFGLTGSGRTSSFKPRNTHQKPQTRR